MDDPARGTELIGAFRAGDPRALARAISRCESGRGADLIRALYPLTGRALTVGLTGPPGVGKSTLSGALVAHARKQGKTVGVISVDPSSPFSHGALLGDRIRLSEHFTDRDVFIRSMASRGHLGGLAGATADAVSLMDAFGKDVVQAIFHASFFCFHRSGARTPAESGTKQPPGYSFAEGPGTRSPRPRTGRG